MIEDEIVISLADIPPGGVWNSCRYLRWLIGEAFIPSRRFRERYSGRAPDPTRADIYTLEQRTLHSAMQIFLKWDANRAIIAGWLLESATGLAKVASCGRSKKAYVFPWDHMRSLVRITLDHVGR